MGNASSQIIYGKNMPIKLVYSSKKNSSRAKLSPIGSFVLKTIDNHISKMQQSNVTPRQLLRFVSQTWDQVFVLEEEARMLEFCGVTNLRLIEEAVGDNSDSSGQLSLKARCTLLSRPKQGKQTTMTGEKKRKSNNNNNNNNNTASSTTQQQKRIDVDFCVKAQIISPLDNSNKMDMDMDMGTVHFETGVTAGKVYGFGSDGENVDEEGLSESAMLEILQDHLGIMGVEVGNNNTSKNSTAPTPPLPVFGGGVWRKAVQELVGCVF